MATDAWQTSARSDKVHSCAPVRARMLLCLWEVFFFFFFSPGALHFWSLHHPTSRLYSWRQRLPQPILFPSTVSMVTVALDCYCSNSTTGNSLQPWSLGGKRHIWTKSGRNYDVYYFWVRNMTKKGTYPTIMLLFLK